MLVDLFKDLVTDSSSVAIMSVLDDNIPETPNVNIVNSLELALIQQYWIELVLFSSKNVFQERGTRLG